MEEVEVFLQELSSLSRRYQARLENDPDALRVRTRDGRDHVVRFDLLDQRYVPLEVDGDG